MNARLADVARIQFGTYDKPTSDGNAAYLQVKHFDSQGNQCHKIDSFLQIDRKNEGHLLAKGDVLLAGKGYRNFAWTYDQTIGPAIASSIFFVIKPDSGQVIPEFLTAMFNLPNAQAYFQHLGAGSSVPSIRKSELAAFEFSLPSLPRQREIIKMHRYHAKSQQLTQQILSEKQRFYEGIVNRLMNDHHEQ